MTVFALALSFILPLGPTGSVPCDEDSTPLRERFESAEWKTTIVLGEDASRGARASSRFDAPLVPRVVGSADDSYLALTDPSTGLSMLMGFRQVSDCLVLVDIPLAREILTGYSVEMPPEGIGAAYAACVEDPDAEVPEGYEGVYLDVISDGDGVMLRIAERVPDGYPRIEEVHQTLHVCMPRTSTPTMGIVFAMYPEG